MGLPLLIFFLLTVSRSASGGGRVEKIIFFRGSKGGLNKGVSARARRKGGRVRSTEGGICFSDLEFFQVSV